MSQTGQCLLKWVLGLRQDTPPKEGFCPSVYLRAEGLRAVPEWDNRIWGTNGSDHLSLGVEMIDVWAVFVAHPERSIVAEKDSFSIKGDAEAARALATEAVSGVMDTWELERNAGELFVRTTDVRIQTSHWRALRIREEDGVQILQVNIRTGGIRDCCALIRSESNFDLMHAILVVECALRK